jgi:hypothetical protein
MTFWLVVTAVVAVVLALAWRSDRRRRGRADRRIETDVAINQGRAGEFRRPDAPGAGTTPSRGP